MARQDAIAIAIGGLALGGLWWLNRRTVQSMTPIATVTTYEGFDLSPYGGQTTYPEPLKRFAQAIARQEGFYVAGSIAQRANNPGNLKVPGRPTLPSTTITAFASVEDGWNALYRQLWLILTGQSSYYHPDMTIAEMGRIWTATEQSYWIANVSSFLGVPSSTRLIEVLV